MKKLSLSILSLAFAVTAFAGGEKVKEKVATINPNTSSVEWRGTKVTGEHNGHVQVRQGNVVILENGSLKSAYVQVDMNSITNEDMSGDSRDKLVGHLKSDDFFSVEQFPFAEIKINDFKPTTDGTYIANGDLTIKGKTEPISFPFTFDNSGKDFTANGTLTFDRSKYDVRFGSPSFFNDIGDKAIHDDVELKFTINGTLK